MESLSKATMKTAHRSFGSGLSIALISWVRSPSEDVNNESGMTPLRMAAHVAPREGMDVADTTSSSVMPALKMSAAGPRLQ